MASYWIVFTRMRSIWIFQSPIFEVIGLPQSAQQQQRCKNNLSPSIRDRVQCKKNLALKKTVFSTFSNFFKKKQIIKAILCNFLMRLLKYF